ncbi:MAG: PKD domain-containing protein [Bradymonadaceae bacterium]
MCSACEGEIPVADAGPDQETAPQTEVTLDGGGSYDPNGQDLSYEWHIASRPAGSSATLSDPTSASPALTVDIAGIFEVCLQVSNEDLCLSEESCMNIKVVPPTDLHIELVWRLGEDPAAEPIDMDIHYRTPAGTWFDRWDEVHCPDPNNQGSAVWWCAPNPDWGGGADGSEPDGIAENDPVLDVDNLVGDGPENINQAQLFDGDGFRVGVHNFRDNGHGPEEVRVRIYVHGELAFEAYQTIACRMFWEVAQLNISHGGTQVEIIPLEAEHFPGPVGYCGEE